MNELNTELARLQEQVACLRRDLISQPEESVFVRRSCTMVADIVLQNAELRRERDALVHDVEKQNDDLDEHQARWQRAEDKLATFEDTFAKIASALGGVWADPATRLADASFLIEEIHIRAEHAERRLTESQEALGQVMRLNADLKRQLEERDNTLVKISLALGGPDEWTDEATMLADVPRRAEDQLAESREKIEQLTWQVDEWRKANLPLVGKCSVLEQQLAAALDAVDRAGDEARRHAEARKAAERQIAEHEEALECEKATWRRHWQERDQAALTAERQLAELQTERNELAAQIEEWGAEKEAACMRAETAESQLAEVKANAEYWLSQHNKMAATTEEYAKRAETAGRQFVTARSALARIAAPRFYNPAQSQAQALARIAEVALEDIKNGAPEDPTLYSPHAIKCSELEQELAVMREKIACLELDEAMYRKRAQDAEHELADMRQTLRSALDDPPIVKPWIRGHVGGSSPTTGNGDEP